MVIMPSLPRSYRLCRVSDHVRFPRVQQRRVSSGSPATPLTPYGLWGFRMHFKHASRPDAQSEKPGKKSRDSEYSAHAIDASRDSWETRALSTYEERQKKWRKVGPIDENGRFPVYMSATLSFLSPIASSSSAENQAEITKELGSIFNGTELVPKQLCCQIIERLSSPRHVLERVMVRMHQFRHAPKSPVVASSDRDDHKDGHIHQVGSRICETSEHRYWRRPNRVMWSDKGFKKMSESFSPETKNIGFEVTVLGPLNTSSEKSILQHSQNPVDGQNPSRMQWNRSDVLNNMTSLFNRLKQEVHDHPLSADPNPTILDVAFDTIDKLQPDSRVEQIVIKSHERGFSVDSGRYYGKLNNEKITGSGRRSMHRAFIAFGSNLGDRSSMIDNALKEMERKGLRIVETSSLWETSAMYVTDQHLFINGACEIETKLSPTALLETLQSIEQSLGRKKLVEKGPRNIDLDILLYDRLTLSTDTLTIPHPCIRERDFVLQPLCEMMPSGRLPPPNPAFSFQYYLNTLPLRPGSPPVKIVPLALSSTVLTPLEPNRTTHVMAILNVTPDSFSDGGLHSAEDLDAIASTVRSFISSGATIIDVGGQSTRPGATPLSEIEEIARVVPVIERIRSMPEAANVAISIDTYRAGVAEVSLRAGADIINDVSAGTLDENMFSTAARLDKTIILMHMRGTPETMNGLTSYPDGVINGVGRELLERVKAAQEAGIRRWRIILDPGIGFAKNQNQNLEILRRLPELRQFEGLKGYPWLIGPSRKNFIGRITGVDTPNERVWGTAAAVAEAVRGGADIVRVHDVAEMAKVVKMVDAIWRVEGGQEQLRHERLDEGGSRMDSEMEDGESLSGSSSDN